MDTSSCTEPATAASGADNVIKRRANLVCSAFFCLMSVVAAGALHAQTFTVELVGGRQAISAGYGDGSMVGIRSRYELPRDVWYAALSREARFDDSGFYASVANTHVLSEKWYAHAGVAASTEALFLPRYRADAQIARKFGTDLRWVGTVRASVSAAHDEHRDAGAGVGLMHYFGNGIVAEGGVFWNRSNPGSVSARRQQLAVTWLRPLRFQVTARASAGREAYQIVGPDALLVDFTSSDASVVWQQWLSSGSGLSVGFDFYDNPAYRRTGITASVFKQFGR
jgi:YaiO family outer membrane protein